MGESRLMELGLNGKVVAVAGSSRGIGRAVAEAALAEGADVVISGRDSGRLRSAELELIGPHGAAHAVGVVCDLSTAEGAASFVDVAYERFGRIDGLVLNVGTGSGTSAAVLGAVEWDNSLRANLWSAVHVVEHALPRLEAQEGASIVFISSIAGLEGSPAPLPYGAAKAAIVQYARALARRLGAEGIRVNTVAPGNVLFAGGSWERHLQEREGEVRAFIESEVPLRRFGRPEEIADVVVFLVSGRSSFITGACFVVDGGQTRG